MTTLRIRLSESTEIEISGDDAKETIREAAFWASLPDRCPVCGADVKIGHRNRKGFDFYYLRCTGEGMHESTFGQHKDGGALFYKESEGWESSPMAGRDEYPDDYSAPAGRQQNSHGQAARQQVRGTLEDMARPYDDEPAAPIPVGISVCADCGRPLSKGQMDYSTARFGRPLCPAHQTPRPAEPDTANDELFEDMQTPQGTIRVPRNRNAHTR